jgi:hypothetical protein
VLAVGELSQRYQLLRGSRSYMNKDGDCRESKATAVRFASGRLIGRFMCLLPSAEAYTNLTLHHVPRASTAGDGSHDKVQLTLACHAVWAAPVSLVRRGWPRLIDPPRVLLWRAIRPVPLGGRVCRPRTAAAGCPPRGGLELASSVTRANRLVAFGRLTHGGF